MYTACNGAVLPHELRLVVQFATHTLWTTGVSSRPKLRSLVGLRNYRDLLICTHQMYQTGLDASIKQAYKGP